MPKLKSKQVCTYRRPRRCATLLTTLAYNADNKLKGWLWSDGKARSISYDSFGLVSGYSPGDAAGSGISAGSQRQLTRDAAGRITGFTHSNNATPVIALNQSFAYDNLNRLLDATLGAGFTTQYSYDDSGNRTSKTLGASTYNNTVSPTSNRLVQVQDVGGTASYSHDAAGHVTSDGLNSFAYSDRGRMSSASNASGTVSYLYNGLNLRVGKTGPTSLVPTGAAYFVYDESGQLLGEYDSAGTPIYETVYLGNLPVGVIKQTGTAAQGNIAVSLYNLHADHLATPRMITRQSDQAIVWRWDSAEAFGGTAANQNPSGLGIFAYNQRFPGQVFDGETGLLQNWNREYDPRQGRYRQSDPIGLEGGINTFAYVNGNPLKFIDLEGLMGQGSGASEKTRKISPTPNIPTTSFRLPRPPALPPGCDGCGSGWNEPLVPDVYPDACNKHDQCYGTPGRSKLSCDLEFWKNAFAESGPWPNIVGPTIYFLGPLVFGGGAYLQSQPKK